MRLNIQWEKNCLFLYKTTTTIWLPPPQKNYHYLRSFNCIFLPPKQQFLSFANQLFQYVHKNSSENIGIELSIISCFGNFITLWLSMNKGNGTGTVAEKKVKSFYLCVVSYWLQVLYFNQIFEDEFKCIRHGQFTPSVSKIQISDREWHSKELCQKIWQSFKKKT